MERIKKGNSAEWFLEFCHDENKKYIFGSGQQAINVFFLLELIGENTKIDGIIVSNPQSRYFNGLPIYSVDEVQDIKDAVVLIAISEKASVSVADMLLNAKYLCVFQCTDWETVNDKVKEKVFCDYMESHEIDIGQETIGLNGIELINPMKEERAYRQMLMGTTFSEIILPFIMKDDIYHSSDIVSAIEAQMKKSEIVFDIGACAGVFSGYASSLGCKVISFEPSRAILDYLEKNAKLSNGIRVENIAVKDKTQDVLFYDRSDYPKYSSIDYVDGLTPYEVRTVCLDDWCDENGIFPDLIKVDIDGHIIEILNGAEKVIKHKRPGFLIAAGGEDKEQVVRFLDKKGYSISSDNKWILAL